MNGKLRRRCLLMACLAIVLPLIGLAHVLAQGTTPEPAGGVGFQWPSILLTLIGTLVGAAAAWAVTSERVTRHGKALEDHEARILALPEKFVLRRECELIEHPTALAAQAAATATSAATQAAQAAALAVSEAAKASAQAHTDLAIIIDGIKALLARAG